MRIVAALGGNASLPRESPDAESQRRHIADAAAALAPVAERHELIVTHGNGTDVGPWLVEALQRELPDFEIVSVRTPTVVEASVIERLIAPKVVIVCAGGGGGGVPVLSDAVGSRRGGEAVVDEDPTAALLAVEIGAHRLLLLTDVEAVMDGWGTSAPRPIGRAGASWFRRRSFVSGSMGPKVDAACRFVELTGRPAFIGKLEQVEAILAGRSGTEVTPTSRAVG